MCSTVKCPLHLAIIPLLSYQKVMCNTSQKCLTRVHIPGVSNTATAPPRGVSVL